MLVVLNNKIYNMERFDSISPLDEDSNKLHRISFCRNGVEYEYASFATKIQRDVAWEKIKDMIENWYS